MVASTITSMAEPQMPKTGIDREAEIDKNLKRRVMNFLHQRNLPALRQIDVQVEEGIVEIAGRVKSFYEKQLCLNCCQRVAGVIQIVDHVEVA